MVANSALKNRKKICSQLYVWLWNKNTVVYKTSKQRKKLIPNKLKEPDLVAHTFNARTQEAEEDDPWESETGQHSGKKPIKNLKSGGTRL